MYLYGEDRKQQRLTVILHYHQPSVSHPRISMPALSLAGMDTETWELSYLTVSLGFC